MKRLLLLIPLVLLVFAGCQTAYETQKEEIVACEPPYIQSGSGCCLDENNNSVCDNDEVQEEAPPESQLRKASAVSQKPEEIKNCNISYAINWAQTGVNICNIEGSKVTARLIYSGKGTEIDGMWFYATTQSGKEKYFKDKSKLKRGEVKEYSVDAGEPITKLVAVPMIIDDGEEKACLNQRMLVVSSELCANR